MLNVHYFGFHDTRLAKYLFNYYESPSKLTKTTFSTMFA